MTKYTNGTGVYQQLCEITKNGPTPLEQIGRNDALKMSAHHHPWSIKPREFDFIRSVVSSYNLKVGFEIATAFGVSSLAAGMAFKDTGGKLVTMDAYIEEQFNDSTKYKDIQAWMGSEAADGFQSVSFLSKWFNLQEHLVPTIGWSPDDVPARLEENHGQSKLDYAFIDGAHWDHSVIRDLGAVVPYLSERWVVLFHDTNAFGHEASQFVETTLGAPWTVIPAFTRGEGWHMAYVTKNVDISDLVADYM